jgi:hypothetical protein
MLLADPSLPVFILILAAPFLLWLVFGAREVILERLFRRRPGSVAPLEALAAEQGWTFRRRIYPHRDTPFLHVGDDTEAGPGFELTIAGRSAALYEHRSFVDPEGGSRTPTGVSVVLRLEGIHLDGIDELRVVPRRATPALGAWLNQRHPVKLESVELEQQFLVEVGTGTTELAARALFTPALIASLLDLAAGDGYLGEYVDYSHGTVVFASGGTIGASDGPALVETVRTVTPAVEQFLRRAAAT